MGISAVFRKAFHDSWRGLIWLVAGLGIYILFVMTFYPTLVDQADEFNDLLNSYPDEMLGMIYGEVGDIDISAPGTFVHTYFASYGVLIIGVAMMVQAFNAVTNAERDGTLDVMLSLPISRRNYLIGRFLNTLASALIVLTACFLVFFVSSLVWPVFDIGAGELALGIYGAFFPLIVVAAFAYMLAALVPSRMHIVGPLSYLFFIGSYLVYGFSAAVEALKDIKPLLLFDYYNAAAIIRDGVNFGDWSLLSVVALVYAAIAWWRIDHKELGV